MDADGTRGRAVLAVGLVLTVAGLAGYLAGTIAAYPGRAFSVTAVMVGVSVAAVGNAMRPGGA